jgi:hypothetical protein
MLVLARAVTYAALFIGLVLIYLPASVLPWSGIARPAALGVQQLVGMLTGPPVRRSLCGASSRSHSLEGVPRRLSIPLCDS